MKESMLGWIEAAIRYGGQFASREKKAYIEIFGLSPPTVSRHQRHFAEAFEEACGIDVFKKNNRKDFTGGRLSLLAGVDLPPKHVFQRVPPVGHWLRDTLGSSQYVETEIERADPDPWVLRVILTGIQKRLPILVDYHSRTGTRERRISPHTLVHVVSRLHVRAYDHLKNLHADFVLSRITEATLVENDAYIGPQTDTDWRDHSTVVIRERDSDADLNARKGVRLDFGLNDGGQRTIRARKALLPYLLDEVGEGYVSPVEVVQGGR